MALIPLIVTAHTPAGFAALDPWSPALEGILAYQQLMEQLGEEEFALGMTGHRPLVEPDLPLGRERDGQLWWWQCSSPIYAEVEQQRVYHHRRFNVTEAETRLIPSGRATQRIKVKAGPYKNYRVARTVHTAPAVSWHCIGERDAVAWLLRDVFAIGAGRQSGRGEVARWTVEPGGTADLARFHRPLPEAFAREHGFTRPLLAWAVRPPGHKPANRTLCSMPAALG